MEIDKYLTLFSCYLSKAVIFTLQFYYFLIFFNHRSENIDKNNNKFDNIKYMRTEKDERKPPNGLPFQLFEYSFNLRIFYMIL